MSFMFWYFVIFYSWGFARGKYIPFNKNIMYFTCIYSNSTYLHLYIYISIYVGNSYRGIIDRRRSYKWTGQKTKETWIQYLNLLRYKFKTISWIVHIFYIEKHVLPNYLHFRYKNYTPPPPLNYIMVTPHPLRKFPSTPLVGSVNTSMCNNNIM